MDEDDFEGVDSYESEVSLWLTGYLMGAAERAGIIETRHAPDCDGHCQWRLTGYGKRLMMQTNADQN